MHAAGEDDLFALLRRVDLHHARAAHRLTESPRDLGLDLGPLTEDRAQLRERVRHHAAEDREEPERERREEPVEPEQIAERDRRREHPANEVDDPRADQVADALGVVHDAVDQHAALRRVEEADREAQDPRLHAATQVGDRALCRHRDHLRERERAGCLQHRRDPRRPCDRREQVESFIPQHLVNDPLGAAGQDQAGESVDEHQGEPDPERAAVLPHQLLRLGYCGLVVGLLLGYRAHASIARSAIIAAGSSLIIPATPARQSARASARSFTVQTCAGPPLAAMSRANPEIGRGSPR